MEREQATAALAMLRKVVSQARDDTALQNWGVIWMCSALTNGAGFLATHVLFSRGDLRPGAYVVVWAVVFTLNFAFIALFKGKSRHGARTFIERQIWSIWNTCIVAIGLAAIVNYLMGLSTMLFMPAVASIILAMSFSIMGAMMGKWWYLPAAIWTLTALVMSVVPHLQFALLAALWASTQAAGGFLLHRAKSRAKSSSTSAPGAGGSG